MLRSLTPPPSTPPLPLFDSEELSKLEQYCREAYECRQMMLGQILSSQARERIARIALVKPEKARGAKDVILRAAQMGQIVEKIQRRRGVDDD